MKIPKQKQEGKTLVDENNKTGGYMHIDGRP
jgi:hypothetical protein